MRISPSFGQQQQYGASAKAAIYSKAEKELPESLYALYRIVDRIARANGLDDNPWRVITIEKYDTNAFAADTNLIAIYSGMLDMLAGDESGLACIVGHEMAHHTMRHIPKQLAHNILAGAEKNAELQKELQQGILKQQAGQFLSGLLSRFTGYGIPGNLIPGGADPEQLKRKKEMEMANAINELSRSNEYEADATGYKYIVKAGFDPAGCRRMLEVFARNKLAEFEITHPATQKRIQQIEELAKRYPSLRLVQEGSARLKNTLPLTYELARDGYSLKVNSRFASTPKGRYNFEFKD